MRKTKEDEESKEVRWVSYFPYSLPRVGAPARPLPSPSLAEPRPTHTKPTHQRSLGIFGKARDLLVLCAEKVFNCLCLSYMGSENQEIRKMASDESRCVPSVVSQTRQSNFTSRNCT